MRKLLMLSMALFIGMTVHAQISKDNIGNQTKTIRLVYPQWQGGNIAQWITEVKDPEQASRGYYLGAQLLNFLAPDNGQDTYTVPVSTDLVERKVTKILFVGLRDWERDEIKARQQQYGIKHLTPEDVHENSDAIREWLKSCGASKVVIHFDMDVLDPAEIIAAVGVVPNGMKIAEVVRVINDIAKEKEIVGLTVAEPMPRTAIRIKEMLNQLPLMK